MSRMIAFMPEVIKLVQNKLFLFCLPTMMMSNLHFGAKERINKIVSF